MPRPSYQRRVQIALGDDSSLSADEKVFVKKCLNENLTAQKTAGQIKEKR